MKFSVRAWPSERIATPENLGCRVIEQPTHSPPGKRRAIGSPKFLRAGFASSGNVRIGTADELY
jgi:hypothetical protein